MHAFEELNRFVQRWKFVSINAECNVHNNIFNYLSYSLEKEPAFIKLKTSPFQNMKVIKEQL